MKKREYSKNSMIGKIYKWVTGNYIDTDSCNVRNTVLFKAPIKALFGINLFYSSWWDGHVQLWFVWATIYQVYVLANWQRLIVDQSVLGIEMFFYPIFPVILLISAFEALIAIVAIGFGIWTVLTAVGNRISSGVSDATRPTNDIINEWYEEIKNKVCKPVSWVE